MNHRDRVSVRALIVVAGMMLVPIVVNASPAAAATIPPAFESATHADTLLNELSSLTISVPATTQNGDVLVLFIESANVEDPSGLSGWTKVDSGDAGSSLRGSSYYHVASSEPASYTLTYPDIQHISAFMLDYRGVDTSDPISAHGVVSNDIDSLTISSHVEWRWFERRRLDRLPRARRARRDLHSHPSVGLDRACPTDHQQSQQPRHRCEHRREGGRHRLSIRDGFHLDHFGNHVPRAARGHGKPDRGSHRQEGRPRRLDGRLRLHGDLLRGSQQPLHLPHHGIGEPPDQRHPGRDELHRGRGISRDQLQRGDLQP